MPLDMSKLRREQPQVYNLVKTATVNLTKNNLDPAKYKAAVIATADHSGSTEQPHRRLYSSGVMQDTVDLAFAAGLVFDDDGEVPVSLFDSLVHPLGNMTLDNCRGFMRRHEHYAFGGTNYVSALQWIVAEAGYGHIDLGPTDGIMTSTSRHWWGGKKAAGNSAMQVRAHAPYPAFAIFITDGEPQDSQDSIIEYLTLMSQLPIFVQFIGVGDADFTFLRTLDEMDGRLVDNANFFDAKEVGHDQSKMLEKMLGEFPDYYRKATALGLIVSPAA